MKRRNQAATLHMKSPPAFPGDKPTGLKRRFLVTVTKTVEMSLDESVITQGASEGDPIFGFSKEDAGTAYAQETAIDHIAFNLVGNEICLSEIDGYANCPDASAAVDYSTRTVDVVAVELASRSGLPEVAGAKKRKAR